MDPGNHTEGFGAGERGGGRPGAGVQEDSECTEHGVPRTQGIVEHHTRTEDGLRGD